MESNVAVSLETIYENLNQLDQVDLTTSAVYREMAQEVLADSAVNCDVREAIAEPIAAIIDAVKSTLDRTPPELAADIMDRGIHLSGGGALLAGLTTRITHETGMPCYVAPDPLYAVAIGSGRALENIEAMRGMMSSNSNDY
jgi:actin-like ATPase involved in cell morphogenesis